MGIFMKKYEFWFITGSQPLYGPEVIDEVNRHAKIIAEAMNAAPEIPCTVKFMPAVTSGLDCLRPALRKRRRKMRRGHHLDAHAPAEG
jgi:L-arabinose isomerase